MDKDIVARVAKAAHIRLTDEELDLIAGGKFWDFSDCSYYGVE